MTLLRTLLGFAAAAIVLVGADLTIGTAPLVTHEWGTFTSVAQENGAAVEWAPLLGPGDLPCFVTRAAEVRKVALRGLVRMETPVLYFYASRPQTISVHVEFPQGLITEWYPNPRPNGANGRDGWNSTSAIEWKKVELLPGKDPSYPTTNGASHYFAARHTDATPLRIGDEAEKMIFYRGLGNFTPPLRARYEAGGGLVVENTGTEPLPFVLAFENQGGVLGVRIAENVVGTAKIEAPPELSQDLASVRQLLVSRLSGLGLFEKEARAMVDTWKDSWFTEGSRVFYIVPRATVDSLLPLRIVPAPSDIQRVFVGRLEVLSPRTKSTIMHAVRAGDSETLTTFGRFLEPFVAQIKRTDKEFVISPAAQTYLRAIATGRAVSTDGYGGAWETSDPAACVE